MDYTGKKISVLGDSISTFQGVTTDDPNTFYRTYQLRVGGFAGVQDTWWRRVIDGLGAVTERVNAFSGSCVAMGYGLGRGMSSPVRLGALGEPDAVLIFGGANDFGFGVPAETFREAYGTMLKRLRETHPEADIWCATLINGRKVVDSEPYFMGMDETMPLEPFSGIIRVCAAEHGARVADLAASGVVYDAIDGCHPTAHGMAQLAALWLEAIRGA